jgi:hypothetical protein
MKRTATEWADHIESGGSLVPEGRRQLATLLRAMVAEQRAGWKEAAVAWACCDSIHSSYAKGKDPFFKTRHKDFLNGVSKARRRAEGE